MKFLVWVLGVMVILLGLESRGLSPSGWTAVWISAAVLWFLVGCVQAIVSLVRLLPGGIGAGVPRVMRPLSPHTPTPEKRE